MGGEKEPVRGGRAGAGLGGVGVEGGSAVTRSLVLLVPLLVARLATQDSPAIALSPAPSPFDEVHALELTADDPPLIEGRGPTAIVELEIGFSGTLHLWTRSELDLFLRVEDTDDGSLLAEDDDSGGTSVPYVRLAVEKGAHLAVLIASASAGALGPLELHVVAAPETEATLEAARATTEGLAEVERLRREGDPDGARSRIEQLLTELLSTPGGERSDAVARACSRLGSLAEELYDLDTARTARGVMRDQCERTLPPDHAALIAARRMLAILLKKQGDLAGARALEEAVLAACERTLPEDHPDLLATRQNLAATLFEQGDLVGARALFEAVLEARERSLPEDHPDLLATRQNLAEALAAMGDLAGARALEEAVLEAYERTLPEGHPNLLIVRLNLAITMREMGDLPSARALGEAVLEAYQRTLPEDQPDILSAQGILASTMKAMGDLAGARVLEEAVLEAYERTLPEDHPDLLSARLNLAGTMQQQGDLTGARALEEAVLEVYERTLPEDHRDLLGARLNLANTMQSMGDLPRARTLEQAVLEGFERSLPEGHPDLLLVRLNLAETMGEMGDLAGARALEEAVLQARDRTLPADHPDLLCARQNLAVTMASMGDLPGARALVGPQIAGMRALVLGSLALAPRQAREAVGGEANHLAGALFLTRGADPDLQGPAFELQETMRMVVGESARALRATEDPEVRAVLEEAGQVRAALGDLASRSSERDPSVLSAELTRLLQERDRLEREASLKVAAHDVVTRAIEIGPLARALEEGAALVTYRRIAHWEQEEERGPIVVGRDHLLAHVLASDGTLRRIDLGEAAELEDRVTAWRAAVGAPLLRGLAAEEEDEGDREEAAGEALRARLLDPVLAVLDDGVERLHVCADDLVYLVPLDALPFEEGRVGDRWTLVNEVSCAQLVAPGREEKEGKGLLALGGVDYDVGAEASEAPHAAGATRSAMPDEFSKLLQTRFEVETTGALAEDLLEIEPLVLTRKDATKAALFEQAPGKRYLHLATHGWFADEGMKSTLDEEPGSRGWTPMSVEQRVTGMAPMLLCGLALAGANRPMDSLGRRPGILTAEELCSLDLSACDLAVLSACETNVGIRRAGQGIQSLQAALYAAGARSSITSLWKVDDAATRRLMELFYTKLWEERAPKARALWEAKQVLRDEGAPVRDWAAWVLTGDPE